MFHRKIHPEKSIAEKEFKSRTNKIKSSPYEGVHTDGGLDNDNKSSPPGCESKDQIEYHKIEKMLSQYGLRGSTSSGNREHWIKTDADCKYLFLKFFSCFFFTHKKIRYYKLQAIFLSFTWPCMQNKQERICDLTVDKFLGRKNAMMPIGFQHAFQHASSTSCPEENRMTVLLNF